METPLGSAEVAGRRPSWQEVLDAEGISEEEEAVAEFKQWRAKPARRSIRSASCLTRISSCGQCLASGCEVYASSFRSSSCETLTPFVSRLIRFSRAASSGLVSSGRSFISLPRKNEKQIENGVGLRLAFLRRRSNHQQMPRRNRLDRDFSRELGMALKKRLLNSKAGGISSLGTLARIGYGIGLRHLSPRHSM